MLKDSLLRSPWSDLAEFQNRPRCYSCPGTCKNEEDLIKNEGARVVTT